MNIADLDFLTPGSIFVREDGREARFLFLTNMALPEKVRKQYPAQVVYADENNNVLSCDIDRFLNKRKFHMVDPELEARLMNLLAISNSDSEDALDLSSDDDALVIEDGEDLGDDDGTQSDGQELQKDDYGSDSTDNAGPIVKLIPSSDLPSVLDAEYLAQAVSSYQQSPGTSPRSVQHSLFIRSEKGITRDALIAAFSPSSEQSGKSIFTFEVEIEGAPVHVNWNEFLGVYPCVFYGSHMYQVIFTTYAPETSTTASVAEPQVVSAEEAAADVELAEIEASTEPETVAFTEVATPPVAVQVEVAAQ
jgi:hypothetical protein